MPTDQDARIVALGSARYLRQMLAALLGHDVDPVVTQRAGSLGAEIREREIMITLSPADARKLADAINRDEQEA